MRFLLRQLTTFLLAAAFVSPVIVSGCAARVSTGYRVHDGYYNDDHVWDDNEIVFYNRWEGETSFGRHGARTMRTGFRYGEEDVCETRYRDWPTTFATRAHRCRVPRR